jgi:3',5'-nucleoside bisphosphate phosphatase
VLCYDGKSSRKLCKKLKNFDLHNHSTASDGLLAPGALVRLARQNGCDGLALTDHDTTDGIAEAVEAAAVVGLRFIAGVEISVSWAPDIDSKSTTLHIVGLNVEPQHAALVAGLASVRNGRTDRARAIGADLERAGIPGTFDKAYAFAENKTMISRTHFARVLVESGRVKDVGSAFQKYLTPGKPGFVPHRWATLGDAVGWIRAAGGVAVIAHPGRYNISSAAMTQLLTEFKALGGEAIEVVTGSHTTKQFGEYAARAREFGLMASRGADYHGPGESTAEPGTLPMLPDDLTPVWSRWS